MKNGSSRFHKITAYELSEESKSDSPSESEIKKALEKEGKNIIKNISNGAYVIVLAIGGQAISSEKLAEKIKSIADSGTGEIDFIIGGSHGLSDEVLARADFLLSFFADDLYLSALARDIDRAVIPRV